MCPERFGKKEVDDLKRRLGPYQASGQLQQRPSPSEGGLIKREWMKFYREKDTPPYFDDFALGFDCSFKEMDDADFVAGFAIARMGGNFYLRPKRVLERLDFPGTVKAVRMLAVEYPQARKKFIEDKANGPAVIQVLKNEVPGIVPCSPDGGKVARVQGITYILESGCLFLPHPDECPWTKSFIESCAKFPNAKYDDEVDCLSMILLRMSANMAGQYFSAFRPHGPRNYEAGTANHCREIERKQWWHRWVSCAWSYVDGLTAHWYCIDTDKRVVVYREMLQPNMTAEQAGAALAEACRDELCNGNTLTIWMDPDNFEVITGNKTIAQQILSGIEKVTREPVFLWAHTIDETAIPDDIQRRASLEARQRRSAARIMLQGAAAPDKVAVWEHARNLMRWWPLRAGSARIEYDRDTALALRSEEDGDAKYQAYMRMCTGEAPEPLPKLLLDPSCTSLTASLTSLVRADGENTPLRPDSAARSFYYGMVAHHGQQNRKPVEEYVSERLDKISASRPNVTADVLFEAAERAQAEYSKKHPRVLSFPLRRPARNRRRRIA